jgi:c-di-GMP-related signal transduction protein
VPTPEMTQALTTLKRQEYKLALDNFVFESGSTLFPADVDYQN